MRLFELMESIETETMNTEAAQNMEINGLTSDSRKVEPGFLFAALAGSLDDGRRFIPDAVGRGAVAVLAHTDTQWPEGSGPDASNDLARVLSDNPRRAFAQMAARFQGRQPETVVAVTGTNGKTSIVSFLRQIWQTLGTPAASLGTLGLEASGGLDAPGLNTKGMDSPGGMTTPDPADLHRLLADLSDNGVDHLAMEASSHGLDQYRLDGVRVSAAAFSNLTRDHLDYHGSMGEYLNSKTRLFTEVMAPGGTAVINVDAPDASAVADASREAGHSVMTYGMAADADVRIVEALAETDGQRLKLSVRGETFDVTLPLIGDFQASNAVAALALAIAGGASVTDAVAALGALDGVVGRMQLAGTTQNGASIVVDYAHTPDALGSVLKALRPHTSDRLSVVFGCGGDRDAGKRPEMGKCAQDLADHVIVTDDNPRGEDAASIRAQVLTGCPNAQEIGDRAMAIRSAMGELKTGDVLVVAGKGHEQGQIIGDETLPFDDAETVQAVLTEAGA